MRTIPEIDRPSCRWSHTTGQNTYISYRYGNNLQTPGTLYRNAFNSSLVDWGSAPTYVRFYYSTSGSVTLNTYWAQDNRAGYAQPYCNGITTVAYNVFANVYYDNAYTVNERRAVTGHELGHSLSIGHIPGTALIALMGYNPDPNVYYVPQQTDIDLVNQIYP